MEDKKMPFAVFILKYIENVIEQNKEIYPDKFECLDYLVLGDCDACPIADKCKGGYHCVATMKKYVESAE